MKEDFNVRVQITKLSNGLKIEMVHPSLDKAINWIMAYIESEEYQNSAHKIVISKPKNTNCTEKSKDNQYKN